MSVYRKKMYSLLHDFLVVYRVSDIDVGTVWHMRNGRVQVEDIRRSLLGMQI